MIGKRKGGKRKRGKRGREKEKTGIDCNGTHFAQG
jgi:hypothetical protein